MLSPKKRGTIVTSDQINFRLHQSNGTASIIESPTASGDIIIPRAIEKNSRSYILTQILDSSFENAKITSLSFTKDSEISGIGSNCFGLAVASTLRKLELPPKVEVLHEDWCFMTPNLVEISLDNSNRNFLIENGVLYNDDKTVIHFVCRNTKKLIIPNSVIKIAASACQYSKLEEIVFESEGERSKLEVIERSAFFGCNLKQEIEIPMSVRIIGDFAFHTNRNLQKVVFEEGSQIERIGVCAFMACGLKGDFECSSGNISKLGRECFEENNELEQALFLNTDSLEIGREAFKDDAPKFALVVSEDTNLTGKGIPENVIRRKRNQNNSNVQTREAKIDLDEQENEIAEKSMNDKSKTEGKEKTSEKEVEELRKMLQEKDDENERLRAKIERMKKLIGALQTEVNS